MLRLNFEPKYSQDRGESQGGASNTAAVSDFNNKGSKFKPYQIPQSFIPIKPVDFDIPQSTPIEISQIEAMRNDLLEFQEIPNAENPILISKAEVERNKSSSITSSIEKSIEQANLVTSEIFQTLEESAGDIDSYIEKTQKLMKQVAEEINALKPEANNNPQVRIKIRELGGILLHLDKFVKVYQRDLGQVADFYRIMYLIAKPNSETSSLNVKYSNPKFYINNLSNENYHIEGLANPRPSDLGEARFSVAFRSKDSDEYSAQSKDFIQSNITKGALPVHLEIFKPQLRIDFSEEYIKGEKNKRKVVCLDLDILTNKNIFVEFRNNLYRDLESITGKNYRPVEFVSESKRSHHIPLTQNEVYTDEDFAQLVNNFRLHFNFSKPALQV
jgi:hypothetical protein